MRGTFQVTVAKDYLVFPAAHFITFAGHRCEPLHGHNYRVSARLEGTVDEECWFVVDFSAVKQLLRDLCAELDHKMLLPIPNTTVEMLAQHLAARCITEFRARGMATLSAIELEVEENFGQSATYRERLA